MTWRALLADQLEFYWTAHLWPRLAGLTDEEYLWEPVTGCWSLRPGPDGRWEPESSPVEPPIPPVTTIAWRVAHVGRDVLGKRARAFFTPASGPGADVPADTVMHDARWWPEPLPRTAADALDFLDQAFHLWQDGVTALDDDSLLRPLGPRGGPHGADSMAALVQHVNREVMAHGAEICLLRDLHRAVRDRENPLVAAALCGDAHEVRRLLGGDPPVTGDRPLVAEAAGLRHWEVVRALVEGGVPADRGSPGALHFAAAAGEADVVALLLARGADADAEDSRYGMPAAGWADHFGHTALGEALRSAVRGE